MSDNKYFTNLCAAMSFLAEQQDTIFMGQAVAVPGTAMARTFRDVATEKLLELPVAEDMQMGMAIGMSLEGYLPICCYPRINFLLLAMNQLVLHLDKIPQFSEYRPKVIIRTSIGTNSPMNPGPQHLGDYTFGIAHMLKEVCVVHLCDADEIIPQYKLAHSRVQSTILVEEMREYG